MRQPTMPMLFEVCENRKSVFLFYENVLKDRKCGRRVIDQAMRELDSWRWKYRPLFESLGFSDWRELFAFLDTIRSGHPARSASRARSKKVRLDDRRSFDEALSKIDNWYRTYGYLFDRLKHNAGRRIADAIENVRNPLGRTVYYVWKTKE